MGFGFDDGDEIKYKEVPLDEGTLGLIDRQYQRAMRPMDEVTREKTNVITETPNLVQNQGSIQGDRLSSAIANRYRTRLGSKMNEMRSGGEQQAIQQGFMDRQTSQRSQQAALNIRLRNQENQYKARMANEEARAAVMRNLLQVAGTLVGAYFGGAAGAGAGNQVTKAVTGDGPGYSALAANDDYKNYDYAGAKNMMGNEGDWSFFSNDATQQSFNRPGVGYKTKNK